MHIARAHILSSRFIGATDITGDPPDDFDAITVVKPSRRETFGVVDMQRDFGEVLGRTRGRAGENHIFHTAAAHSSRTVFAHHPTERFKQVGLAATIRANNAG